MANRHKAQKKASGGKVNEYNAASSPEIKEAKNKAGGFKKGGVVDGKKSHKRLDKKGRGKMSAGGSPLSSANKMSNYTNGGAGEGHQNDGPKGEKD